MTNWPIISNTTQQSVPVMSVNRVGFGSEGSIIQLEKAVPVE